jgi:serine/threonine-protein kinase
LRADYPLANLPNEAARTVARAMQRYGIVLADGGNVALTARSDRFTPTKWSGLLTSRNLDRLLVTDFEMIEAGTRYPATYDCVRAPPPVAPVLPAAQVPLLPIGALPLLALALVVAATTRRRGR